MCRWMMIIHTLRRGIKIEIHKIDEDHDDYKDKEMDTRVMIDRFHRVERGRILGY